MHSNGGIGRGRAEAPGERQAHRGLTPANEDGRPTASRQIVSPDPDINCPVLSSRGAWSLRPRLAAAHSGHHPEQRRSHRAHHHRDDRRESAETLGGQSTVPPARSGRSLFLERLTRVSARSRWRCDIAPPARPSLPRFAPRVRSHLSGRQLQGCVFVPSVGMGVASPPLPVGHFSGKLQSSPRRQSESSGPER